MKADQNYALNMCHNCRLSAILFRVAYQQTTDPVAQERLRAMLNSILAEAGRWEMVAYEQSGGVR